MSKYYSRNVKLYDDIAGLVEEYLPAEIVACNECISVDDGQIDNLGGLYHGDLGTDGFLSRNSQNSSNGYIEFGLAEGATTITGSTGDTAISNRYYLRIVIKTSNNYNSEVQRNITRALMRYQTVLNKLVIKIAKTLDNANIKTIETSISEGYDVRDSGNYAICEITEIVFEGTI